MISGPRLRVLIVGIVFATGAACGARWTSDQESLVMARDQIPSFGEGSSASAQVGAADPESAAAPTGQASSPDAGTASVPAGAGPSGPSGPSGGPAAGGGSGVLPCSAPSDAPGVTAEQITVGSLSSLSGVVSGLGSSSAAAVRAYAAYRNANGGVCGRVIEVTAVDDGTDPGRYRTKLRDLEPDVLGVVGGFALGDVGGVDVIRSTGIPVVNVPGDDAVQALPTAFDLNPPYPNLDTEIGKYRFLREQGVKDVAIVYLAVAQSRAEANVQQSLMRAAGMNIVDVHELQITTLSYDAAARRAVNSGADYVWFIGDVNSNRTMANAMMGTDHDVAFVEYFAFVYSTDFVSAVGPAAEGAITWLRALPNEEAGDNAELAAFLEWMERIAPGEVTDPFALDSWASAKAFFDTLETLSGPITRQDLVSALTAVGTFDAGGMYGPVQLGSEVTSGCVVGMQVRDGRWQRLAPATGFLC